MRVSAVIPHRNSGDLLGRCVDALAAAGVEEVVVADEGSDDGSADAVAGRPGVRVLQSPGRGFAVAVNAAVADASGDRLLLMNSDAFVRPDTVARLSARLDAEPRLGLVGPALVDEHGARAKTHSYLFTLRRALLDAVGVRPELRQEGSGLELVEAVFPTCALARREALEEIGGFDERFLFYYEDQDVCRRLARAGWLQAVDWDAEAVHVGGGSTSARAPQRWFRQYHASRVAYLRKHYPRGWRLYALLWGVRASLHSLLWSARGFARRLRADRAGTAVAREWASAFRGTVFPAR